MDSPRSGARREAGEFDQVLVYRSIGVPLFVGNGRRTGDVPELAQLAFRDGNPGVMLIGMGGKRKATRDQQRAQKDDERDGSAEA